MQSLREILIKRYAISLTLILVVTSILIILPIRSFFIDQEKSRLEEEARILSKEYVRLFDGTHSFEANDDYLRKATAKTPIIITLIDKDGLVLGDSKANSRMMENHLNRYEVDMALRGEVASVIRESRTTEQDFIYAAAPVMVGSEIIGAVRVSLPEEEVILVTKEMWLTIFAAFSLLILVVVALSLSTTKMIASKLERISEAASKLASGDLSGRVPELKIEDFTDLAQSFNRMAAQIGEMMEAAVKESEKLKAILDNIGTAVIVTDQSGKIVIFNRACEKIFGVSEEGARGKRMIEVFSSNELESMISGAALSGEVDEELGLLYPKKLSLRIRSTPLFDERGYLSAAVTAIEDITLLKEMNKVRTDFVANVSHELRTPVASIKALTDSLVLGKALEDPEMGRKFLTDLSAEVDRLVQLIEDLLTLSQLESRETALKLEDTDLLELVKESISAKEKLAREAEIKLNIDPTSSFGHLVTEKSLLSTSLGNLIDNAIKYNFKGGAVTIKVTLDDNTCSISVKDAGIGIPREELPRIFERFYRVDRVRSKETGGTGLGTSIVKHIAELLGGWVTVESVQNEGSTFTIKIPVKRQFT